jgi:hypothetical protein
LIRYLKHNEIDKAKWDATLAASPQCLPYAFSWYLDKACSNWDALIEDDYQAVMPLPHKNKLGINYIFPPYFIQQLGVFSRSDLKSKTVQDFTAAIPEKFKFIEYNLNVENSAFGEEIFMQQKFEVRKNLTYHLSLQIDYPTLSKNYSQNLKRNLKRASTAALVIQENVEVKTIVELFRKNRGKQIDNLKANDYETFLKIIAAAKSKNAVKVYGVNLNDVLCAGAIFLEQNGTLIFIFSATNAVAKETGAMPFLIDSVIQKFAGQVDKLDFEGSNNTALARFYKSFGADEKVYFQIKRNNLPQPIRWLKK